MTAGKITRRPAPRTTAEALYQLDLERRKANRTRARVLTSSERRKLRRGEPLTARPSREKAAVRCMDAVERRLDWRIDRQARIDARHR